MEAIKTFLAGVGAELRSTLYAVAGVGLIAAILYWLFKREAAAVIPTGEQVSTSLKSIVKSAPGAALDLVRGKDDSTYITTETQRRLAEAALARKRAVSSSAAGVN